MRFLLLPSETLVRGTCHDLLAETLADGEVPCETLDLTCVQTRHACETWCAFIVHLQTIDRSKRSCNSSRPTTSSKQPFPRTPTMPPLHQRVDSANSIAAPKTNSQHSNSLTTCTNNSLPQLDLAAEHATHDSPTQPPNHHRLEAARQRIVTVCAECNYFNPTFQIAPSFDSPSETFCLPDSKQIQRDLQTMFERFLALESVQADGVYEDMAVEVEDVANNEYLRFDWEVFQEAVGRRVRMLREQGYLIELCDLETLPVVGTYL